MAWSGSNSEPGLFLARPHERPAVQSTCDSVARNRRGRRPAADCKTVSTDANEGLPAHHELHTGDAVQSGDATRPVNGWAPPQPAGLVIDASGVKGMKDPRVGCASSGRGFHAHRRRADGPRRG